MPTSLSTPAFVNWPAPAYCAATLPRAEDVSFVACGNCTLEQWPGALSTFTKISHQDALTWGVRVSTGYSWSKALELLDARAATRGTVKLPDVEVPFEGAMTVPLSSFLQLGYRTQLAHLEIVSPESMENANWSELFDRLDELPDDVQQFWLAKLSLRRRLVEATADEP